MLPRESRLHRSVPQMATALLFSVASHSVLNAPACANEAPLKDFLSEQLLSAPSSEPLSDPSSAQRPPADNASAVPLSVPASEQVVFLVGLRVGNRSITPAALVRGLTDDTQAVELSCWQVPTSELFPALGIAVNALADGQLELTSPGFVVRIDADVLTIDPDLGEAISVEAIQSLLGIPVRFDLLDYALVLEPSWSNRPEQSPSLAEMPVITAGLPTAAPPRFSLSAVRQEATLSSSRQDATETAGELSAAGSVLGGSWYARAAQPDIADSASWRLQAAQYLRQTPRADYVVGSQPSFWPTQSGRYWGLTTVQRFGFEPDGTSRDGFSPAQRMQRRDLSRSLVGDAAPGTLVRLVSKPTSEILAEVLVDASGRYQFEAISTAAARNSQLLLYPEGQLFAEPEVRRPEFLSLPGQLSAGSAAAIASIGVQQRSTNSFIGQFENVTGGVAYRWGASDSLTVGLGAAYDESLQGLAELFYQPTGLPLRVALSATSDGQTLAYDASVLYRPSDQFYLSLNGNEESQRLNASWRMSPRFSLNASGSTSEQRLRFGASGSMRYSDLFLSGNGNVDTEGAVDWTMNARWQQLQLYHRRNPSATSTALSYVLAKSLSSGHSTFLRYDTQRASRRSLLQAGWRYRTRARNRDGQDRWRFELGYGIGSERSGLLAATQVNLIPGIDLQMRYEAVSLFSDDSTFSVALSPSLGLQPALALSDTQPEDIRTEGTMLVQPFLDMNANGLRDPSEPTHLEDLDLLLRLNYQKTNQFNSEVTAQGMRVRVEPGTYRLDLDPAGYLLDWHPAKTAYAVEVVAGGQTRVAVPFVRAYTVSGTVRDPSDEPIAGAVIKATSAIDDSTVVSVTNRAGVFFLEGLAQGTHQLSVNGDLALPQRLSLDEQSPPFQQLDLSVETSM